jgi:hypothetical protein
MDDFRPLWTGMEEEDRKSQASALAENAAEVSANLWRRRKNQNAAPSWYISSICHDLNRDANTLEMYIKRGTMKVSGFWRTLNRVFFLYTTGMIVLDAMNMEEELRQYG